MQTLPISAQSKARPFSRDRIALIGSGIAGGAAGVATLTDTPMLVLGLISLPLLAARLGGAAPKVFAIWGALYSLCGALWLAPAMLTGLAELSGPLIIALMGALIYGSAAFVLASRRWMVAWPVMVGLAEYGTMQLGFVLHPIGLATVETPLGALAPYIGVYGLTVMCCAIVLTVVVVVRAPFLPLGGLMAVMMVFGEPEKPDAAHLGIQTLTLAEPGAPKWAPHAGHRNLEALIAQTQNATGASLVVWSENAVTVTQQLGMVLGDIRATGKPVLFGMTLASQTPDGIGFKNAAVFVNANSYVVSEKQNLVPVAERNLLIPQWAPVQRGTRRAIKVSDDLTVLPIICYEAAFPLSKAALDDVDVIVVLSAEGSLWPSLAATIMTRHARMRALETNLPVIRASDTGL